MRSSRAWRIAWTVCALLAIPSLPARAGSIGRNYELRTLESRYAASLVIDLCDSLGKRPDDCKVHVMNRNMISVFASMGVHDEIVRLLAKKDTPISALGFRVILVRPGGDGRPGAGASPEIRRALAAVEELLGVKTSGAEDTGLIWTSDEGTTRLSAADGTSYDVGLRLRSVVTSFDGTEATLDLVVTNAAGGRDAPPVLSSVVSLHVGETIVGGASRARPHDQPMVILLTALPIEPREPAGLKE